MNNSQLVIKKYKSHYLIVLKYDNGLVRPLDVAINYQIARDISEEYDRQHYDYILQYAYICKYLKSKFDDWSPVCRDYLLEYYTKTQFFKKYTP